METKQDKFIIATLINDDENPLMIALRDLPITKTIFLVKEKDKRDLTKILSTLETLKIKSEEIQIEKGEVEELANVLKNLKEIYGDKLLLLPAPAKKEDIINLVLASIISKVRIVNIKEDYAIIMPKYEFQLMNEISETKKKILELLLKEPNCCSSLNQLSKKLSLSLPLVSYHIYGTPQNPGLEKMGLVTLVKNKNKIMIELTDLGKLVAKGFIE